MNPMQRIDTAPIEHAVEHAIEVVTDTFSDVTDTIGDHLHDDVIPFLHDDVIPLAKQGARQTRTFVRRRTRVSLATVAGIALVIGLFVWYRRRSHAGGVDDHRADLDERRAARSVA